MSSLSEIRKLEFEDASTVDEAFSNLDLIHYQVSEQLRVLLKIVDDNSFSVDQRSAIIRGTIALMISAEPSFETINSFCNRARNVLSRLMDRDADLDDAASVAVAGGTDGGA